MAHVAFMCPRYAPAHGGAETFFRRLAESLVSTGHRVTVRTTDASSVRAFTEPGDFRLQPRRETIGGVQVRRYAVRYVPAQRYVRTLAHALPLGRRWKAHTLRWTPWVPGLGGADADERVALVHAGALPYSSILCEAVRLARDSGARLVMSPFTHVAPPGPRGDRMRRAYLSPLNVSLLNEADAVFVQTELEREALADAGVRRDTLVRVGVGVDPNECTGGDRAASRRRWGLVQDEVIVGHLANKSWDKGTLDLLDAVERAWAAGTLCRVLLAGPEMPAFTARWARCTERDRIVNLGVLTDEERRAFYAAIDVFALPSYVESFGMSPLEAGLNGAAVVAYDHGGPGVIFTDRQTARLVPPGDVEGLAHVLRELARDAGERARLGAAAHRLASGFTWREALRRAHDVYDGLLCATTR